MGQTNIWTHDFESSGGYNTSIAEFSDGSVDYFSRTNGSNISSSVNFSNIQDSYYFAAQDIDGEGASLPVTLTFNDIDISNYENLNFYIYLAEDDDGTEQDWDNADYVHIEYDLNNSGSFSNLISIEGTGGTNSEPALDTNYDGTGDVTNITETFTEFSNSINSTGSSIDIKITFYLNSSNEDIALDNLRISGSLIKYPTNETAIPIYSSQIDLSWNDNSNGDNVLLAFNTSNSFGTPSDGFTYNSGANLSGATVLQYSGTDSYSHTGLNTNATYYYKIWSYDGSNYSSGVEFNATTYTRLVINEILADPDGDANGDGTMDTYDDEFVELINTTNTSLDISGWKLYDGTGIQHTFEQNTQLPSEESIVIFGGGTPTNIPGLTQVTGSLGLNNGGDDIIIKDDNGATITSYTYGTLADNAQSIAREPDLRGNFVKHNSINSRDFSPGRDNTDNSALPVELSSFYVKSNSKAVSLVWQTETEVNNYGFEIERKHSNNTWNNIGFVKGKGNSNSTNKYKFVDEEVSPGKSYYYRLKQIDTDGKFVYSSTIDVTVESPTKFALKQNYPNPFNPETTIKFSLPEAAQVSLTVYNSIGEEVAELVNGKIEAGIHNINFNAEKLKSGIYIYRIHSEKFQAARKMLLLK